MSLRKTKTIAVIINMKWKLISKEKDIPEKPGIICWQYDDGSWDVDVTDDDIDIRGDIFPGESMYWHPLPEPKLP